MTALLKPFCSSKSALLLHLDVDKTSSSKQCPGHRTSGTAGSPTVADHSSSSQRCFYTLDMGCNCYDLMHVVKLLCCLSIAQEIACCLRPSHIPRYAGMGHTFTYDTCSDRCLVDQGKQPSRYMHIRTSRLRCLTTLGRRRTRTTTARAVRRGLSLFSNEYTSSH